jgi:hypothetical protein
LLVEERPQSLILLLGISRLCELLEELEEFARRGMFIELKHLGKVTTEITTQLWENVHPMKETI